MLQPYEWDYITKKFKAISWWKRGYIIDAKENKVILTKHPEETLSFVIPPDRKELKQVKVNSEIQSDKKYIWHDR